LSERQISYEFDLPTGRIKFPLNFIEPDYVLTPVSSEGAPEWTKLSVKKCPNCPLSEDEHSHCPLALQLYRLVEETDNLASFDEVHVKVRTPERVYVAKTSAQRALSSILGLMIPCSGCPHTSAFRPMARFHLPFSSEQETTYRTASMYLLAQFFRDGEQLSVDQHFEKLNEIYERIQVINRKICERLRTFCKQDSSLNAVVILDMLSMVVPLHIENNLEDMKPLFSYYTQKDQ
jgi:hypothetical protein